MNNAAQNTSVTDTVNLSRRSALFNSAGAAAAAVALPLAALGSSEAQAAPVIKGGAVGKTASTITTRDGVESTTRIGVRSTGQPGHPQPRLAA
jgi:non-heme chloroperoxidase